MTGSAGQQRINVDFVGDYPIPFPPLAAQQELINELKQDEKDKERQRKFIKHQVNKRERILRDVW